MASPILLNTSNFLGVALVVNRLRDGPLFVFHYPPHILPPYAAHPRNSGSRDELDDDDELLNQTSHSPFEAPSGSLSMSVDAQNWNHDGHLETDSGSQIVPWEHVAGYPTKDLESLLTPNRAFHKKLFQVSLEQLCFASYPIYVPENGIWRKKKKQPKYRPSKSPEDRDPASVPVGDIPRIETGDMADDADTGNQPDEADKKSGMTMFNLVFILNPKKHEVKEVVETLYLHIIKKVNKVYKYSQQRSDFIWKESKRILELKDKARGARTNMSTLWREILDVSSLAASMQDVYEAVSHNKIAALQLETAEGTVTHSVQIPMPFCIPDLPPKDEGDSKGLWLTTANYFVEEDNLNDPDFIDKNFTLLLMSDGKKIISELQADPDETTAAMIEFVRLSKPTMSFRQISQGTALSPAQVRKYAQHFIFWRRAIAIPPLHARDVYMLSPNSDIAGLPRASQAWARAFPLAPPLPEFLACLSAAPRSYKWFAPSKNHRPTYLAMLAWLMRGGWVTQLCTFAYVVVWPEIRYQVDYEVEAEELRAAAAADHEHEQASDFSHLPPSSSSSAFAAGALADSRPTSPGSSDTLPHHHRAPSSPTLPSSPNLQSTATTTGSPTTSTTTDSASTTKTPTIGEQVAEQARLERIADKAQREAAEKAAAHARKPAPAATDHPSTNGAAHLAGIAPYVIVDAKKATGTDSLYLSAIGRRFRDPKVRAAWPAFWKYFNGRTALERVALLEDNLKPKDAWLLLTAMSEHLVCVRHW
ncbi:nitrogen permease regulator of amino acid transport activity 3-domain-containing protein [Xylariaceae sp. FL0662B]|nr:nitrogen permease regulator of amino acid transport activity 3-domain-containing protein [Xylariaceae sp. FL0662B]